MASTAPDLPPIKEYQSSQYEFNDEQNREFASLADAMRVTAGLLQLAGLAFVVLAALDDRARGQHWHREFRYVRAGGGAGRGRALEFVYRLLDRQRRDLVPQDRGDEE